jgi:tRNA (guanine-N7-)-methyltransferase
MKVGDILMRLRNVKNAEDILKNSKYYVENPKVLLGNWNKKFKNNNKICLEIGMGKGDFIIGMAKKYPGINFIGVEKYESVLVRAVQKLDKEALDNVLVISYDAINLGEIFDKEIDTIYLNFSDPWPKKRHYKRRLTYRNFLEVYDKLFESNAKIILKTDNDGLFESSLVELNNYGYTFKEVHLDLWKTDIDNIKTEYEEKFGNKGFTIKYLSAYKNNSSKTSKNLL